MNLFNLEGKIALITGGVHGLGMAMAKGLGNAGAKIVVNDLSQEALDNAVAEYRTLIGATDPTKAEEGTIRKLFAKSIAANAVHGSDSDENAQIESNFFFSQIERF